MLIHIYDWRRGKFFVGQTSQQFIRIFSWGWQSGVHTGLLTGLTRGGVLGRKRTEGRCWMLILLLLFNLWIQLSDKQTGTVPKLDLGIGILPVPTSDFLTRFGKFQRRLPNFEVLCCSKTLKLWWVLKKISLYFNTVP